MRLHLASLSVTIALALSACGGGSSNNTSTSTNAGTGTNTGTGTGTTSSGVTTGTSTTNLTTTSTCASDISSGAAMHITYLPNSASAAYKNTFCKYTSLVAANGKPIHIYAQDLVSNEQMIRARSIMQFFLTNVSDSEYGADKTAVANKMGDNNSVLLMLNGSDLGNNELHGQPLYQTENTIEGSAAYINNDYDTARDAAFEEILHLVHTTGIGIDGSGMGAGALNATYQAEISTATNNAQPTWAGGKGLWAENQSAWYNELKAEGSLTPEYLAAIIDSYYGFWGAWNGGTGGMWDIYVAKTREDIQSKDPMGWALVNPAIPKFFSPWITYTARLDANFDGTFSLAYDTAQPYTHKSQYLLDAQLLGSLNSGITGNDQANQLTGNSGDNTLTGGKGNDTLTGGEGVDTAVFTGAWADYTLSTTAGVTTVTDNTSNRDGTDTLTGIESVQFSDQTQGL